MFPMILTYILLVELLLTRVAYAAQWNYTANLTANALLYGFDFEHNNAALVNSSTTYVDRDTALKEGLVRLEDNGSLLIRVDNSTSNTPSRTSVRLESPQDYGDGLLILDAGHVPLGCGTWPAFWTRPRNASYQEIDVAENINSMLSAPISALHTKNNCSISFSAEEQIGQAGFTDCSNNNPDHTGCTSYLNSTSVSVKHWGSDFNNAQGGLFIVERDIESSGTISIWAFARSEIPENLRESNASSISTATWPKPSAKYRLNSDTCNERWVDHMIVLNIAIGGDWAEATYSASGCSNFYTSMNNQIMNIPGSFNETYWAINSLAIYTNGPSVNTTSAESSSPLQNVATKHQVFPISVLLLIVSSILLLK